MDMVEDSAQSDGVGKPSKEPRRPSPEPLALGPRQPDYNLDLSDFYVNSPEMAAAGMVDEIHAGGFDLVRPGIDRADIVDLLEKKMSPITGSWSVKGGELNILSHGSLKLMVTHDSKNTMILTPEAVVDILKHVLSSIPDMAHIPELKAAGTLNLALRGDGELERVPDVPFKWSFLRRTDEDRRDAAAATGDGAQAPRDGADRKPAACGQGVGKPPTSA